MADRVKRITRLISILLKPIQVIVVVVVYDDADVYVVIVIVVCKVLYNIWSW